MSDSTIASRGFKKLLPRLRVLFAAVLMSQAIVGCGGSDTYSPTTGLQSGPPPVVTVSISPTTASIPALGTQQYKATVTGTSNKSVTWSIQSNGNQVNSATISQTGLVTTSFSGGKVPSLSQTGRGHQAPGDGGSFTITATSIADPSATATATLIITGASAVQVAVTPAAARVPFGFTQQFQATVTGNANTGVTWSARLGTISPTGLYTAPDGGANDEQDTVTATSVVDPSKTASAVVTLLST